MSVGHYENFPVASVLLPRALRQPVAVIYRFARAADDLADEGDLPAAERLRALDGFRQELDRIESGTSPGDALFRDLADVIRRHALPIGLFRDLLDAFSQDVVKSRYADFRELLDYCRRSANPIGRLLLHLFSAATPANEARSDSICSALQLVNFWQDVAIDHAKGRIYFPAEDMARFGVAEADIGAQDVGPRWQALIGFEVERARAMLEFGAPLATGLHGRIGLELRMIVQGGLRILEKIERVQGDVFRHRPVLRGPDWALMSWRALRM